MKFDDGVEYWGIICNHGTKRSDVEHPDGRWHVLFDDQTEGRFDDDDTDGESRLCGRPLLRPTCFLQIARFASFCVFHEIRDFCKFADFELKPAPDCGIHAHISFVEISTLKRETMKSLIFILLKGSRGKI